MNLKKIFLLFLILLNLAAPLSAGSEVKIKVAGMPDVTTTWPPDMARLAAFHEFLRQNPDIEVEAPATLKIEGDAEEGNEYLAIAGGIAPDVFFLFGRKIGAYIEQKFIQPLTPFIKEDFKKNNKVFSGIGAPDNIWEIAVNNNEIWCVPYIYYVMGLMYQRQLFVMSGLDPNKGPQNWEELYRFAQKITWIPQKEPGTPQDVSTRYGFMLDLGGHVGWKFHQFVWSAGGEMVRPYKKCSKCGELKPSHIPAINYDKFHLEISNKKDYQKKISKYSKQEKCGNCGTSLDNVDKLEWRLVLNEKGGKEALEFYQRLKLDKWMRCDNRNNPLHKGKNNLEIDLPEEVIAKGNIVCPICEKKFDLTDETTKKRIYTGVVKTHSDAYQVQREEFGMSITTLQEVQTDVGLGTAVTYFPSINGENPVSFIAGAYLAMNSQTKGKAAQAAWQFIKFMSSEEAMRIRVRVLVDNGWGEWVTPKYLKKFGYDDIYNSIPKRRRDFFTHADKNSCIEPYCKGYKSVMTKELRLPIDLALDEKNPADPQKVLDECAKHVNTYIIGELPEKVIKQRTRLGFFLLIVTAVILLLVAKKIIGLLKNKAGQSVEGFGVSDRTWRKTVKAWIFLFIAVASVLLWQYVPLGRGLTMAFQDYRILGDSPFVGLRNFVSVFSNREFYVFLYQTLIYVGLSLILGFATPIILAILLTEIPKGKVFLRVVYYLPSVTTGLVTMFLWKQLLFNVTEEGVLNGILLATPAWVYYAIPIALAIGCILGSVPSFRAGNKIAGTGLAIVGLFFTFAIFRIQPVTEPLRWLQDKNLAMGCVIIPGIWAGMGAGCLIYLAALKGIPDEQYEAADVDGAGTIAKLWNVLIPNIKALIIISFVGAFIGAFHAAQNIFVMTAGGPANSTMTIGLDIWYHSFLFLKFGYATAESWILGAMLIGFTLMQLQILNKVEFKKATD
ncbi:extracellular solute-binding protein [bacterium]|nr:extracellular solute-binding protein [bacterium]